MKVFQSAKLSSWINSCSADAQARERRVTHQYSLRSPLNSKAHGIQVWDSEQGLNLARRPRRGRSRGRMERGRGDVFVP